jgi:serine/threonine protein kinase
VLPGPLQVGDLLAGRYLLLDPVASEGPAVLWRAQDEVLAREVAVRVLPTPTKSSKSEAAPFLRAAALAGQVAHPGLVRVYDAGVDQRPGRSNDVTYLIREWVDGEPLDEHLERVGPLSPPDAADVLRQVADALAAAHAGGLAHGRLHPRNVLVTDSGRVRLTDAAVAAAVHDRPVAHPVDDEAVAADTRDAAALLYALLTTRWPQGATPQPPGGLVPSPQAHGHAAAAHQVRAGVPRMLDNVLTRALDPGRLPMLPPLVTPAALADAADVAVADLRRERVLEAAPREPGLLRRHTLLLSAVAAVAVFATAGWYLGLAIGEFPRRAGAVDALVTAPESAAPGTPAAVPLELSRLTAHDFDPEGDGQENPDQVRNALDPDPSTAWTTDVYRSAAFGGLKPGVGLLLDLGTVRAVHGVQVGFTAPGATVELRVANTAPARETDARTVASTQARSQVAVLAPPSGTTARYVLVWITRLPRDGSGYRVGIAALRVT